MVGARIVLGAVAVMLVEVVMVNGEDVILNPPGRHDVVVGAVTRIQKLSTSFGLVCFLPRLVVVCQVPAVFVLTWMSILRLWLASLAIRSMPFMLPEKVTA